MQSCGFLFFWPLLSVAAPALSQTQVEPAEGDSLLAERFEDERKNAFNPYLLTAHKPNFVLPVSYTNRLNTSVYESFDNNGIVDYLKQHEVKFQLSVKVQLNENDLFKDKDGVFLGFTLGAWWQLYSKDVSSPFRETNYQPEIFYITPVRWQPWGGNVSLAFGLEHQSNGQVQGLSRSWNRLYTSVIYERENFVALLRPWYRIPEKAKESVLDSRGDDNPDITDYMGHGEMLLGWRGERYEATAKIRANTDTGKGAVNLSLSFPMYKRFRGVVSYFNGYGESLIEYDIHQQRLGFGVLLSNLF